MNIKIKSYKDINVDKWNKLVRKTSSFEGQYLSYEFITSASKKWSAFILDDYTSAFAFTHDNKLGYNVVFQPFFTRYFSFVGDFNNKFISYVFDYLKENYKYVNINLPFKVDINQYACSSYNFQKLDLNKSYKSLHDSYSANVKRILKKKKGLVIEQSLDVNGFIKVFKNTVGNRLNYKKENYSALSLIIDSIISNSSNEFLQIKIKEEVLAFAIFFKNKDVVNFFKGAVTENGKKLGAMQFLIDHYISKNANTKMHLDFGGSNVKSVADFYRKFGAEDSVYYNYYYDNLPITAKALKELRNFFRKI